MLSSWLSRSAYSLGINVTSQTSVSQVRSLLNRLRPRDCGIPLIRLGGNSDGGYLLPDDLDGIKYCFSPGVNTISDFENDLADLGVHSFLADYSVEAPPVLRPEFTFHKKFLGIEDNEQFLTMTTWKSMCIPDYNGELLLQMDIEGHEWLVIASLSEDLLAQFRIIVIEFHDMHRLFDRFGFSIMSGCFSKLLTQFDVVHIHPNNCAGVLVRDGIEIPQLLEITFLNKSRVRSSSPQTKFPNSLDRDNDPRHPPVTLPECWYL